MSISELLFCTLAPLGAWESSTEGISAIQQHCHTSPTCWELQMVPNPSGFSALFINFPGNSSNPEQLDGWAGSWLSWEWESPASHLIIQQLGMVWEARAEVWWKGEKTPGELIINGLTADPGEVLPRKIRSCKMAGGREKQWRGFNQMQGCPAHLILRVLTLSLQIKHLNR